MAQSLFTQLYGLNSYDVTLFINKDSIIYKYEKYAKWYSMLQEDNDVEKFNNEHIDELKKLEIQSIEVK